MGFCRMFSWRGTWALFAILAADGYDVDVAYGGQEGVEAALRNPPDVVLLDIEMPEVSGYEAARRLRARLGRRCPQIVAISVWGQESARLAGRQAGFNYHLTKPVAFTELEKSSYPLGQPAPAAVLKTLDGKTVRLADLEGSVVVLDFWATWCVPCWTGLRHTQELAAWAVSAKGRAAATSRLARVFLYAVMGRTPSR